MIKACITCLQLAKGCKPDLTDPGYALDCWCYEAIPREVLEQVKIQSPRIYEIMVLDESEDK